MCYEILGVSTRQSPPVHVFYKWVCRATLVVLLSNLCWFSSRDFPAVPCIGTLPTLHIYTLS